MTAQKFCKGFAITLSIALVCGCSTTNKKHNPQDPLEGYNRGMYAFNQKIDNYLFKPIAQGYRFILPAPVRKGVTNAFINLNEIPTFINSVLQANLYNSFNAAWRFAINSTMGIGGLFDVAGSYMDIPHKTTDLGVTFGIWGYKNSSYFVLPILGPSTIRDAIGLAVNYQFFTVYPWIDPAYARYAVLSVNFVNERAQLLDLDEARKAASLDPYSFDRSAYMQYRQSLISGEKDSGDNDFADEDSTLGSGIAAEHDNPNLQKVEIIEQAEKGAPNTTNKKSTGSSSSDADFESLKADNE